MLHFEYYVGASFVSDFFFISVGLSGKIKMK